MANDSLDTTPGDEAVAEHRDALALLPRLAVTAAPTRRLPSPAADAMARIIAELCRDDRPLTSVMIGSAVPSSGVTTVATHLAYELARRGDRVVLVDADLADPGVARQFGAGATPVGLLDVLEGTASLDEALYAVPALSELRILPAGDAAMALAAHRLQASVIGRDDTSVGGLARRLVADGCIVVVDAPCLLDEEAALLAGQLDALLLVDGPRRLPPGMQRYVDGRLRAAGARVVGIVVDEHATVPSPPPTGDGSESPPIADRPDREPDEAVAAAAVAAPGMLAAAEAPSPTGSRPSWSEAGDAAAADAADQRPETPTTRVRPPTPTASAGPGDGAAGDTSHGDDLLDRLLSHLGVDRSNAAS